MSNKIVCKFVSQEAIDNFNKRNNFNVTKLTKEYNVHTHEKVEGTKEPKKRSKDKTFEARKWWEQYWWQMPTYESHDEPKPFAKCTFIFGDNELKLAEQIFNQNISERTKWAWYPELIPGYYKKLVAIGGSSEHKYPIYVISKGRWDKCYTSRYLTQMEVKHFVVCEPSEYEKYKEHVENEYATLLQLDMSYKDRYDTCDNMDSSFPKGSGPARNFVWDDSIKRGAKWHWIMDDNATSGFYVNWHNEKVKCRTGAIFGICENFVDRYENIGQFGLHYDFFCASYQYHSPFTRNTRVYSCILNRNDIVDSEGKPIRWRGRFNEDTDLSIRILKSGYCTVLADWNLFGKANTMTVKGGNTDTIYVNGTTEKSEMIARLHPDIAKVMYRFHRVHHYVDYSGFTQELKLKPGVEVTPGENNYGVKIVMLDDEEDKFKTKSYLDEKYKDAPAFEWPGIYKTFAPLEEGGEMLKLHIDPNEMCISELNQPINK